MEEDTWTDEDTSILVGDSSEYTDTRLQVVLRADLGYLGCADTYTPGITSLIRSLDRCSQKTREGCQEECRPYSFAANLGSNDKDNTTYNDVHRGSSTERVLWEAAMVKELKDLRDLGSFKTIKRLGGENILDSTWVFRKNRYRHGYLKKYKAKLCVHGDHRIEGADVFETYVPVVLWISVRLLLVLSIVMVLYTQQVSYTNAFCQAPLDQTIYVELLRGFEQQGMMLELQQSVYGLRQSPLNVYHHVRQGLESREFEKSEYDECLFNNGEVLVLLWVDDCIFYSRSKVKIGKIIESLKDEFLLK